MRFTACNGISSLLHNLQQFSSSYICIIRKSGQYSAWPPMRGRSLLQIPFFSFCCMCSSLVALSSDMSENSRDSFDEEFLMRLQDPVKWMELWKWLNFALPLIPFIPGGIFSGASAPHLIPSGMVQGAQPSSIEASPTLFPPI